MSEINPLKDSAFLSKLDLENLKTYYIKILVLDQKEIPLRAIEGRVSTGSITIDGSSSVRRAGNLTFLAEEKENDLTDIDNLLSMNKKIKILVGLENTIDVEKYDNIIWFNQGIFIITQPSISHTTTGVTISLQIKDKMCLLNGECGGNLPTSVTFHEYDQIIGYQEIEYSGTLSSAYPNTRNNYTVYGFKKDGTITDYLMWDASSGWSEADPDLVGTTVACPQLIWDIIQTLVCNYGGEDISKIVINDIEREIRNSVRYTGSETLYYNSKTDMYTLNSEVAATSEGNWLAFGYNEDCGYIFTDFIYPGELISSIGDNVCTILDKIKSTLGNYEYFYDVEGNFVFQEIKNYLNTSYTPVQKLDEQGFLLDSFNYYVDFSNTSKSVYTFTEGSSLISSFSNSPSYTNIKNDFHIWGKNEDASVIHYHLAIKEKPTEFGTYSVVAERDELGQYTGRIHLATASEDGYAYIADDWRAELYLRGLEKKSLQLRPDIYEQELLDLFDAIYDMRKKEFKSDMVNHPNDLTYWFDYLEPIGELEDISVDVVGPKIYSYQQDKIKKLYNCDVPTVIMINSGDTAIQRASIIQKCEQEGQQYSNVSKQIYKSTSLGTVGYTAEEVMREILYQYTNYMSSISISSIPIYYLNANSRITVHDRASGIYGDYVIKSITLPLDAKSTMSISATRALERV